VAGNTATNTGFASRALYVLGDLTSFASVVAENAVDAGNCYVSGTTTASSYSVEGDTTCGFTNVAAGDQQAVADVEIGPAQDNGGLGPTMHPDPGSPLKDAVPLADCDPTVPADQRGISRPQGHGCDVGAVEVEAPAPCGGLPITVDIADGDQPTPGPDVIRGTDGDDVINGLGGNDVICAGAGDDIVRGGPGNDRIYGNAGADVLRGGPGNDWIYGGDGQDRLHGGKANDRIFGGNHRDIAFGGPGHDRIFGQGGNDLLNGQTGRDLLDGGPGKDRLNGGPQRDTCHGRGGHDSQSGCEVRTSIP
jgi:Ca2+-binding RTX toxin-like protein